LESNLKNLIKIAEDSSFKGSYSGIENLELNGSFEGSLKVKNLYIKKTGVFLGYVSAENIVVEGEMNADVQTENFYLKSSGIVDGEITYRNIIIDSGGLLKSNMVQNISSMNNLIKLRKS
jgi:cytoskeletal protein CcmA (bactofilin family)